MKIQGTILSGRYQILSEIGRGSGSIVYLARHQKLEEYRAVKCILKEPDSIWRIREADILNHLNHPRIPRIYDMEEDHEAFYLVEEYAEGESLEAKMLQSSFITLEFIVQIIKETAEVLHYLHHLKPNPMIYQDLKPEHIIVGTKGVKLIDFGIALYLDEAGNKFQNYGTPRFCAPEKLKEAKISIQTDIYSIGRLLEELIYTEGNDKSQCLMHVARKAVNADLSERYTSVEELLSDLTSHMQSSQYSIYQGHLLTKIVAAGSQPHIGTTHLSVSFTQYFNQHNTLAVYREKDTSNNMRTAIKNGRFAEDSGLYRRNGFFGMPAYGEGVRADVPERAIEISDYGTDLDGALSEEFDMLLLMIGSREWEMAYADLAFERLKGTKGLAIIANYGSSRQAKQYRKRYGQAVYCFPLDFNPFYMTKEKERFFEGLLEKEGKQSNKHWNCRIDPRRWSNALVCGVGKLCSKRTR